MHDKISLVQMDYFNTDMLIKNKSQYDYTALFCEENIWHLCRDFLNQGLSAKQCDVIFMSNHNKNIVLFSQQLADFNEAVIWDYHVVLQATIENKTLIFDFDSRLDFPLEACIYWQKTLPKKNSIRAEYLPCFRVINAAEYCRYFHSDRQHIQNMIEDHQFPTTAPILKDPNTLSIRLNEYWNMQLDLFDNSRVFSFDEFLTQVVTQSSAHNHNAE